ncbi:MAG: aminopeptidase P family protein [Microcoleus sp.]
MARHFPNSFFITNRKKLLNEIGGGSFVILTGHGLMQRANDCSYPFEQEPNFWYLCGVTHPDWWLLIDGIQNRTWLVHPDVDDIRNIFDGSLDQKEALKISGADAVIDRTEARRLIGTLRQKHSVAYTLTAQAELSRYGFYANPALKELHDELRAFRIQDCRKELNRLRAIKQQLEIEAIQAAIDITAKGFAAVRAAAPKLHHEYELEAIFGYEFRRAGSSGHAYDPIVAADQNACTLHYVDNSSSYTKSSWLLADVGARYEQYCADVTRTFPVGKPTKRVVALYEAVLRVHDKAIALCTPGQSVREYHKLTERAMAEELVVLKLIKNVDDEEGLRTYFPHAISHGLGIDVHDSLGSPIQFAAGMVLTVEPGLYVENEKIGIRIEDDILITESGPKNLSAKIPTRIDN